MLKMVEEEPPIINRLAVSELKALVETVGDSKRKKEER